jgi:hypothetical protein
MIDPLDEREKNNKIKRSKNNHREKLITIVDFKVNHLFNA